MQTMAIKRSLGAAGRRLRIETLEDRAVPAATTDTLPAAPADDATRPAVVGDPPVTNDTMADGDVIFTTQVDDPPVTDTSVTEIDLAAHTAVDKIKPSIGDIVTVTVSVENNGTQPATGVAMNSVLPAGLTFVSAAPMDGTSAYDAATGAWDVGTVGPDNTATLMIKAKVTDPAAQAISANITSADQPDPEAGNNAANLSVTPVLAGLTLTKTSSTTSPVLKSTVAFTLILRNSGPGMARDIAVTDTLGTGLTFVKVLPPSRGTFVGSTKTWNIPTLPAGASAMLQVVTVVNATGRIESPATVTGTGIDDTRSKLDVTAVVVGVTVNTPATWSYHAGAPFKPGPAPVPYAARPLIPVAMAPSRPILPPIPPTSLVAQLLLSRGLILPGPTL
jgi:uncharacterized repeat protein (TIGR01451 family)